MAKVSKNTTRAKSATYLQPRYFKDAYFIGKDNGRYKNHVFIVSKAIRSGNVVRAIEGTLINTSKKPAQRSLAVMSKDLFEELFYYHDPGS